LELEAQLGHARRSRTEIYALASPNAKDTVQTALQEVLNELTARSGNVSPEKHRTARKNRASQACRMKEKTPHFSGVENGGRGKD
jgi:hypothetical protein